MPTAELNNGRIEFQTTYRDRERMKLIPGARWDTYAQTWWAPISWATCVQARGVFGEELQVGAQLGAWARNERETRITPCLELRNADDASLARVTDERLRPFQRAGIKFLATSRQALCGDDMGTGKTLAGILTLEEIGDDAFPALVVCPNSMKFIWEAEYANWASHRRVVVIHGGKNARVKQIQALRDGEYNVGILNWEGLRGHTRLAPFGSIRLSETDKEEKELNEISFRSVIADEAHRAKEPKAQATRALWWLSKDAENRIALTGTPIANSPEDAWAIMHFVSPEEFSGKSSFIDRYALKSWNMFGGLEIVGLKSETKDELFSILDPRFIRRTKAQVLPQLPPKTYVTRTIELSPKQRKAYDTLRKEMLVELDSGILIATNPLTKIIRLLQLASAYGQLEEDGSVTLTDPSCACDALEEIVEELGDQRAVVFAESKQLINLAHKRLVRAKPHGPGLDVSLITGDVDPGARDSALRDFTSGRSKVMLMTLATGGTGLSFPGCSTAIFLQRSFNAVHNLQAEDRIDGIGRGVEGVPSTIIDVIALDTMQERVHEVRAEKAEMLEEFVRDEERLRAWLSK